MNESEQNEAESHFMFKKPIFSLIPTYSQFEPIFNKNVQKILQN